MTVRTQLKAGRLASNHSVTLQVRSALKAGGTFLNHNASLRVRSTLKAGGVEAQHNETLQRASARHTETHDSATDIVWMRRQPLTRSRREDRLTLLVVRAGLRAGRRARGRARQ